LSEQEKDNESRPFHLEGGGIVFDKPKSQEEIARETREREQHEFARSQVKTNKRLAWFTGALVVATFCTIGVGVWQGCISQKASNAARDAADAATAAANVASGALVESKRQTEIQREEVEGELAATIIVDSPRPTPFSIEESSLKRQGLYLYFANAGKVPATKITAKATLVRLGIPRFESLGAVQIVTGYRDFLVPEQLDHPAQGFVTEDFHVRFDTDQLSTSYIERIRSEDEAIRVNGIVEYDDGFGRKIPRSFCFMFARIPAFDDQGRDANGTVGTWGLCDDMLGYIKRTYKQH
jgi:hypothetical protein